MFGQKSSDNFFQISDEFRTKLKDINYFGQVYISITSSIFLTQQKSWSGGEIAEYYKTTTPKIQNDYAK